MIEADNFQCYYKYITFEVLLPQDGEHICSSEVISFAKNDKGNVITVRNSNPIIDTPVYNVMFPDGSLQQYTAIIITRKIYAQVDAKG